MKGNVSGVGEKMNCSRWESNPRPLVHKTNDLPIDLQELLHLFDFTSTLWIIIAVNFLKIMDDDF